MPLIVESTSLDVYRNLACEEALLEGEIDPPILFFWRSAPAVVFGKNQNPWLECRLDRMAEAGVLPARRISGGGAVYHDEGNLNYAFIVDRRDYREERFFDVVIRALAALGVRAERMGRNGLAVNGKKVSGVAFCHRGGRVLHHGTLLLRADLDRLRTFLGPCLSGIETRAVRSVPASVANLDLKEESVKAAVEAAFCRETGMGRAFFRRRIESMIEEEEIGRRRTRFASSEWIFDTTPRFTVEWCGRRIFVEKGKVFTEEEERYPDRHISLFRNLFSGC